MMIDAEELLLKLNIELFCSVVASGIWNVCPSAPVTVCSLVLAIVRTVVPPEEAVEVSPQK